MGGLETGETAIVPLATLPATAILNTSGVAMSGAVTWTTTVATSVPERSALTRRIACSARPSGPAGSCGKHELSARMDPSAAMNRRRARRICLRRDDDRRGTGDSLKDRRYRGCTRTGRSHESGAAHDGDAGVERGPGGCPCCRIALRILDSRGELRGGGIPVAVPREPEVVQGRRHCDDE